MTRAEYKKDKKILFNLNKTSRIVGWIYFILATWFFFGMVLISFKESDEVVNSAFLFMPFIANGGMSFSIMGMTQNGATKNSAQAREMAKGAMTHLDALSCMPVRKESILRYIMENFRAFELVMLASPVIIGLLSRSYTAGRFSAMLVFIFGMIFSFTFFHSTFTFLHKSKKFAKAMTAINVTLSLLVSTTIMAMIIMNGTGSELLTAVVNTLTPSAAGIVIMGVIGVIYMVMMEITYRRIEKKAKEVYWYEYWYE